MSDWMKWAAPAAVVTLMAAPAYAVQYLSVTQAQKLTFPTATEFVESHLIFTPKQIQAIEKASGQKVRTRGLQVWQARASGKNLGSFIVDYVIGKHLVIDYALALDPAGAVNQVEILEYRESYGGEIRNADWRKQFKGKTHLSPLQLNEDIINISGATLSSRHVTEGIKRVLITYAICLP
jgi:Na+-translocating ferredoxin:NAD+ oxidoreductase RnfG subunit